MGLERALKGRHKELNAINFYRPCRGSFLMLCLYPGQRFACPGLFSVCPIRGKYSDRSGRADREQSVIPHSGA